SRSSDSLRFERASRSARCIAKLMPAIMAVLPKRPSGSSGMSGVFQTGLMTRVQTYAMIVAVNNTVIDTIRTKSPNWRRLRRPMAEVLERLTKALLPRAGASFRAGFPEPVESQPRLLAHARVGVRRRAGERRRDFG